MPDIDELLDEQQGTGCICSCHSRHPGRPIPSLHDGGVSCICRLTPEEAAEQRKRAFDHIREWWDSPEFKAMKEAEERDDAAAAEWGVRNGVEYTHLTRMVPNQIEGSVTHDGEKVTFYFRERHGLWDVRIPDVGGESIAAGSEDEYSNTTEILKKVREAVIRHSRKGCSHPQQGAALFCPDCGTMKEDQ